MIISPPRVKTKQKKHVEDKKLVKQKEKICFLNKKSAHLYYINNII